MSFIIDFIENQKRLYIASNYGLEPRYLRLGEFQIAALRDLSYSSGMVPIKDIKNPRRTKNQICGLEIVVMNRDSFFEISYERLL